MKSSLTPMMQQWHECKKKSKDALLLFRLGDFYEAFYDDAKILSKDLELTLTKRGDIPMSGIPAHTMENYIEKLINKGHLIAIAEQIEDPKETQGLVKRDIVRILSPGCVHSPNLLKDKTHNFFASVFGDKNGFSLAFIDLTTGIFQYLDSKDLKEIFDELVKLNPSELLIAKKFAALFPSFIHELTHMLPIKTCLKENYCFEMESCEHFLKDHFNLLSLDGFGLKEKNLSISSAGALLCHLKDTLFQCVDHLKKIEPFNTLSYMSLDRITQKNLELLSSQSGKTLFELIDYTSTPMGGRLLKMRLSHPLLCAQSINDRLSATCELLNYDNFNALQEKISSIKDLERLITRILTSQHTPRDIWALKLSLDPIEEIKALLKPLSHPLFQEISFYLCDLKQICILIDQTLNENPPLKVVTGRLIKLGINEKLDQLKILKENSENFLLNYQDSLREQTQIKTLKVGFSKAFGYFIEVSRGQSKLMPESFHKRQTLINSERYTTETLKNFEQDILSAEETISKIEQKIYSDLRKSVLDFEKDIRSVAQGIALLDCLISSTKLAKNPGYSRPIVDNSDVLEIKDGRHPIVENSNPTSHFISNDTFITDQERLLLITGPNMAGKSTYIRQVALIVIMAQIGLYVPAAFAHIGIVDKIFTRIGASDDLFRGQSTFMVEMTETANILNNVTNKSLVILDEIGRGTSTYDGISIARSVAEFLLTQKNKRAKTLFATHYFELTDMPLKIQGAINYNIAVQETEDSIIFLRKIRKGAADKSYGIHVAKLAGLPLVVIQRAKKILKNLEKTHDNSNKNLTKTSAHQLSLFDIPPQNSKAKDFFESLQKIDINTLTPLEAFDHIRQWVLESSK